MADNMWRQNFNWFGVDSLHPILISRILLDFQFTAELIDSIRESSKLPKCGHKLHFTSMKDELLLLIVFIIYEAICSKISFLQSPAMISKDIILEQ